MTNVIKLVNKGAPINLALAVIFDTENKKILITKRKKRAQITELIWCFPGGKINYDEELEKLLEEKIREKLGLRVANLGSIFAETHSKEKGKLYSVYCLCEFIGGEAKLGEEFEEVKWVSPEEIEEHFGSDLHPALKEYLIGLK
ncbi:MAG: NUDIX hydrolase [Nanoarchaeota archaeon]